LQKLNIALLAAYRITVKNEWFHEIKQVQTASILQKGYKKQCKTDPERTWDYRAP
jgi:hypothetical protein